MEVTTSKKTKEPPKKANHKWNIKFPNPLLSYKHINKGRGRPRERTPSLEETLTYCDNTFQNKVHMHTL
jgi:hypothetical protein